MITAQQARAMMPPKKQDIYNTLEARIKEAAEYGLDNIFYEGYIFDQVLRDLRCNGFTIIYTFYSNRILISWEEQ